MGRRTMARPHIEVLLDDSTLTTTVSTALERLDADIEVVDFPGSATPWHSDPLDARLVLTGDARSVCNGRLGQLLARFDEDPCATLVVSDDPLEDPAIDEAIRGRAISFATAPTSDYLTGRLSAMCTMGGAIAGLRGELNRLKRRDETLSRKARRIDEQMRLAGQVQRDLLPSTLPNARGLHIRTVYRPSEAVSGDLYNVERLDESHVAFALADATGHGLPAALLSVYVHRLLRGKEISGDTYRLLDPIEVLSRLNGEIVGTYLPECQFVAAAYAIFDERTRVIRWARGGLPHPVFIRPGEPPRSVVSAGPLVGVLADARYEPAQMTLEPGDQLLLFTDGMDALLTPSAANAEGHVPSVHDALAGIAADSLDDTISKLETRLADLSLNSSQADDLTVIGMQAVE